MSGERSGHSMHRSWGHVQNTFDESLLEEKKKYIFGIYSFPSYSSHVDKEHALLYSSSFFFLESKYNYALNVTCHHLFLV